MITENGIYFDKEWEEINLELEIKGTNYYVTAYPLDITESDTIVIRAYLNIEKTDDQECGNGIWIDSGGGSVTGNDELYFENDTDGEIENKIISEVFDKLKETGVI